MTRDEAAQVVDALFDSWYDSMVRFAFRLTGLVGEAEEVVQDAFLRLFHELCSGTKIENPKAWTFCVVRRRAARRVEHHIKREVPLDDAIDFLFAPVPLSGADDGDMERMLGVLTPRELEVVLLRLESMKYREIGEALGISPNSVNVLLARALRKIQTFLSTPARRAAAAPTSLFRSPEDHDFETLQ